MKRTLLLVLTGVFFSITFHLKAQNQGIGTDAPDASAILDLTSTDAGILIPRMTSGQRIAIPSPATGLMVYDNTTSTFWYFDGTNWIEIDPVSDGDWTRNNNLIYNETDTIAIGRSTAEADFHLASGKRVLFGDAWSDSTGFKLKWYGDRGALRFGYLNAPFGGYDYDEFWDDSEIGFYSFAGGRNSRARGFGAFAFGSFGWADGSGSVAFFGNAAGNNSFTFGGSSQGRGSITFEGTALDEGGIAMYGYTGGRYGVSIGGGTTGLGASSAREDYSIAIGWNADARRTAAIAIGPADAYGYNSFATNWITEARGNYSSTFGYQTISLPYACMSIGRFSEYFGDSINWVTTDPVFQVGDGTSDAARSNSVTILKNGRIGIQTSAPAHQLHVFSNADASILLEADANDSGEGDQPLLLFSQDGGAVTGHIGYTGSTNHLRIANNYANSDADIDFQTQSTTRMTIDGVGNVGIKNSSPLFNLHVGDGTMGAANVADTRVVVSDNTNDNRAAFLTLAKDLAGNRVEGQFESDGDIFNSVIMGSVTTHPLYFRTANTTRMAIDAIGKVGIGTTVPDATLDVFGNAEIRNDGAANAQTIVLALLSNTSNRPILQFSEATTGNINNGLSIEYDGRLGGGDNKLHINDVTGSAVMTVESNGQVGIGTTTPGYQLQLSTNSAAKPTSSAWTIASDIRLKDDIRPFTEGLSLIEQINPVWFTYTGKAGMPNETGVGTLAQEFQKIAPYMVTDWIYTDPESQLKETYLGIDYGPLQFALVNAIQEQQEQIDELRKSNEELQQQVRALIELLERK